MDQDQVQDQALLTKEIERLRQRVADLEQQLEHAQQNTHQYPDQHEDQGAAQCYQAVFEQLPIPVNIFSLDGTLLDINICNANLLNVPRGSVTRMFNLLKNEEACEKGHAAFFQQALAGTLAIMPPTAYSTASLLTDDTQIAKTVWTETTYVPIQDKDGQVSCVVAINMDVTERKLAEEALNEHKARLIEAQRIAHLGSWEWVLSTGKLYWTEETYRIFGLSPAITPTFDDFLQTIHPDDLTRVLAAIQHTQEYHTTYAIVYRIITPQGEERTVNAMGEVVLDENQTTIGMIGTIQNITTQAKNEAEIHKLNIRLKQRIAEQSEEHRRLIALIENSTDFIGISTLEGNALYVNKGGRTMLGIPNDQEIKDTAFPNYVPEHELVRYQHEISPVLFQQGMWQGEFTYRHFGTNESIPVHYTVFVINDLQTEQPIALGHVCRDITQQKQTEEDRLAMQERIIQAQRAALHELSTPLVPLSDAVIMLPLVGTIDSGRAQQVMETLLEGIAQHQAEMVILDITGVPTIDTQVARALVQTARAARLLGTTVILTGISPAMAQTLVHLGADLSHIITCGTLQSGIAKTMDMINRG